jgi:catecholate siderophore receptor
MLKRSSTVCRLALIGGLFAVFTPRGQAAAQQGADSSAKDSTGRAVQELKPVRIESKRGSSYAPAVTRTATKTAALPRDIPQSLVTVTSALAKDQAMQGLADVVRYVPGATIAQGEGNRDQVTIRGNNSTADFFVDGVRDDVQYFRDLYNLEKVEALKGSNAMVFGRGGGGGLLNRVTKQAEWRTRHRVTAEGGTFGSRRISTDLEQRLTAGISARLNSVYENSDLYRSGSTLERSGFNPTITFATPSRKTLAFVGYEFFDDRRTADRGIPSFLGKPIATDASTFFGNAGESKVTARVNSGNLTLSHDAGRVQIRNATRFADYDKLYQNIYPGAVTADGSSVSISGYSHATDRTNLFNQTDVNVAARTGIVSHDFLFGLELGRQDTDNFRKTAFFDGGATTVRVPVADPIAPAPAEFRQTASDADNGTIVRTTSLYAQDQIGLNDRVHFIAGVRLENFGIRIEDLRGGAVRNRTDRMISPRAGLVAKPSELVSIYASYGLSFLPGSGDQFSSLTDITEALEPERFANLEAGVKWDVMDRLALTAAAYRLDRTNTRSIDPAEPTRLVQTGAQRSQGIELGATGDVTSWWHVAGGYSRQDASIISATASSAARARVPLVPRTSVSLWNRFDVSSRLGFGVGAMHQSDVFAAIDNAVTLPSFERYDAAVFARLGWGLDAQVNVENMFDARYYPTAHSNNNITPGAPRSARFALTARF